MKCNQNIITAASLLSNSAVEVLFGSQPTSRLVEASTGNFPHRSSLIPFKSGRMTWERLWISNQIPIRLNRHILELDRLLGDGNHYSRCPNVLIRTDPPDRHLLRRGLARDGAYWWRTRDRRVPLSRFISYFFLCVHYYHINMYSFTPSAPSASSAPSATIH